jgi:FtsH-binding integral membrane protein
MSVTVTWFAWLYAAWIVLLLLSAILQKDWQGRRAALVAVVGLAVSMGNLFTPIGLMHTTLRVVALAVLGTGLALYLRVRGHPSI